MVFVFDLDGTLLKKDNTISPNMVALIKRLDKNNHRIVFASGRMLISIRKIVEKYFQKMFPIIAYNGAMVFIPNKGIIFEKTLDFQTSKEIIELLRNKNIHRQAYINDELFSEEDNENIKFYSRHAGVEYKVVEDLIELIKHKNSTKLLAIDSPMKLDKLKEELENLNLNAEIFKSMNIFLDIVPKDVNKAIALKYLLKTLKAEHEKLIVFGDNHNDIPLFKFADFSIAVGNAVTELKKIADFVSKTNDEDGVYYALTEKFPEFLKE
ncbi:Cof-type HAD-IIB family hydrolase [Thermosipho atlanticus]|uniref:Cof subfamily of IIB subfamily of haloacid dehalogenase superfamily/HAD-superfamily hydrolase, subfamily IIB n=1 Tax=Thermosipho atlanticus DSM 15807 TaxID=1123380 RepID=A0A1M5T312_9BACT|nr:Cof-type HAD-IIB family hydrolase [Thermosipho atlanticus]SHH44743.1 hypothetical protein SAMN02745199_1124 [Thermosipho atlanticus DSM 15807]